MIDNYTIQKFLTKGSHSDIYLVQDTQGKTFISKTMYYTSDSTKSLVSNYLQSEQKNLRNCTNSNTIHLIASSSEGKHTTSASDKPCMYLISSFCSLGSLESLISLSPSENICKFFFKKIIIALESIHSLPIFHLNIKGALSKKCDVFSIGVVLFILVCGHPPFLRASVSDQYFKLLQSKNPKYWKIFRSVSEEFKELINGILKLNPSERFDLESIKAHCWVNEGICIDEIDNIRRKLTRFE